jgi:NADP-dependent aldehyde dehydrogenase
MSSVNPVLLAAGALEETGEELAAGYVASLTLGAGQFCTNPGLVFLTASPAAEEFIRTAARATEDSAAQTMLTPAIAAAYRDGLERLRAQSGVMELTGGAAAGPTQSTAALFSVEADEFVLNPALAEEIFGPAGLIVQFRNPQDMAAALQALPGQLTVTVHATESDYPHVREVLPLLEKIAGRIVFDGWPTGVEVTGAMVHGGPFPATSNAQTTSVGTLAIDRFLRPVAYQDMPLALQPPAVQSSNPLDLTRRIDGSLQR